MWGELERAVLNYHRCVRAPFTVHHARYSHGFGAEGLELAGGLRFEA